MSASENPHLSGLRTAIATDGFAFVRASVMREVIAGIGGLGDWPRFADSWNDLALDTYMADGGRYRRRRHAVLTVMADGAVTREAHQPHYQSLDYNPLHGGVERWFEPVLDDIAASESLVAIVQTCRMLFGSLSPAVAAWRVEVHQFRIEARSGQAGRPTPEGLHRDGVDYVLVLLINRRNIASGVTGICDMTGRSLGSFTLTEPLDAAWVDDHRVAHGVTPVEPIEAGEPAYRDVLVVTFTEPRPDQTERDRDQEARGQ